MKTVAILSGITALANAHATWQQLWKNGEDLESSCARLPTSNSPIEDYTSTALQCNVSPSPASGKCGFAAGDTVTIEMHAHNTRLCTEEGIGGAHWGPVLAYMGKVDDAATADGSGEFFKVYQNGWKKNPAASQGDNDFWGTKDMNYNCGKLDFTIPTGIAPGDYLLRAEAIALHAASASGGAQHYVTCYQITVTGSGTLVPKGVTFPSAYSKTGPGLGFSIHADLSDYPVPGPALIAGGTEATPQLLTFGAITGAPSVGTGAAPAPASAASSAKVVVTASSAVAPVSAISSSAAVEAKPTAVATPVAISSITVAISSKALPTPEPALPTVVAPSSVAKPTATAAPATSSVSSKASAPTPVPSTFATIVKPAPTGSASESITEYSRCGGEGFTGIGSCAVGLECKQWNPYYFQCIKPDGSAPAPTLATPAAPKPTTVAPEDNSPAPPTDSEPTEKTYTLETFIAFLEQEAGGASAAKIRRMIEALQL